MPLLNDLPRLFWKSLENPLDPALSVSDIDAEAPPLWQLSSFELMNGVDVTDFSKTITGEAFQDLFLR
jgi:hypothetical protein